MPLKADWPLLLLDKVGWKVAGRECWVLGKLASHPEKHRLHIPMSLSTSTKNTHAKSPAVRSLARTHKMSILGLEPENPVSQVLPGKWVHPLKAPSSKRPHEQV